MQQDTTAATANMWMKPASSARKRSKPLVRSAAKATSARARMAASTVTITKIGVMEAAQYKAGGRPYTS